MSDLVAGSTDRPRRTRGPLAAVMIAFALVAPACGDGDGTASDPVSPTSTPPTSTTAVSTTAAPSSTASSAPTPTTEPAVDCTSVPTGMGEFVLDAGGAEHDVRVYVPTTFDGSAELALVMNFHGYVVTGDVQAAVTGYEAFAEEEGSFVVVHPTAVPSSRDNRNSWELAQFDDPAKDDLAFTNALLDLLIADYCVDESRVYATGLSGGGMFTSRLVCDMSDRIAAASSVAGISFPDGCDPQRAVPFMAIHGTEDRVVPFDGDLSGTTFEDEPFAQQLLSAPIAGEFVQFAEAMGCDAEGERIQQSTDIVTTTYTGCEDDIPLVFHEVANGGHTWPGTPLAERLTEFQGYITSEIDATADSWSFFEQHTLER